MTMKTDAQVQKDVVTELAWEPSVEAARIGVMVKDGVVTLVGHVNSLAQSWEAECAARRVQGVRALAMEIDVTLPGASQRDDADIARLARSVLEWTTFLPRDCVKVLVEGGWVTLTGQLEWEYQRRGAVDTVRHLMGVEGVIDQISVKPLAPSGAIRANIEAALKRLALPGIAVEVRGGDVSLTGTVHTWSERDMANHSAWGTPGVRDVVDNVAVDT
jgi:osmotically-inducible protein OsmY